ncbi:adhesion G protein-coupled receptor E5-like [Physella acuta]|uniref:adhesion G protein-coupled receptor E5-like n=1 Tax=Physella acuta TaxID=109671 RepID=UPI0027DDD893|nr:adhesion G protein-coupled receptor E5-like [Physella acuta]
MVAIFLHYIFLVVFCIMLGEGVLILKTVVYVFDTSSVAIDILILAYGFPTVIISATMCATNLRGYGDETFCWLSSEGGVIWAFIGPVIVIMVINVIILVYVIMTMLRTRAMRDQSHFKRATSAMWALLVLSGLLGTTWVVGVLTLIDDSVYLQYVFVAVNSSQGLFILCFQCLGQEQVREALRNLWRRHTSFCGAN